MWTSVPLRRPTLQKLELMVLHQRAELIAWYERLGYARTGETAPFPYDNLRSAIPKVDDLSLVFLVKPLVA